MSTRVQRILGATVLAAAAGACWAQTDSADIGRLEFEGNCASCHGLQGKGDGPMKFYLTKAPSDLTTVARRNGGVFPVQLMWEVIDGRATLGAHGGRDMPVWGTVFRRQAAQQPGMASQPEWYVRGRVIALLDYLDRMQQK